MVRPRRGEDILAAQMREVYSTIWSEHKQVYGIPQQREVEAAKEFLRYLMPKPHSGCYDYGCGMGRASIYLHKKGQLDMHMVDIADDRCLSDGAHDLVRNGKVKFSQSCIWLIDETLEPKDWFYSSDLLEHIPESRLGKTLEEISKRTVKGGMFIIANHTARKLANEVGGIDDLHQIQQPFGWWVSQLKPYFAEPKVFEQIDHRRFYIFVGMGKRYSGLKL